MNKIVLVTGATSGIGEATAKIFGKNGYNLIICGRRKKKLSEMSKKLKAKYGISVIGLSFDIRDKESVKKAIKGLKSKWQNVDILINNAGLAKGYSPIHEGQIEDWEQMVNTNVLGLLYITRYISPNMVNRKSGHIINVCSTAGHEVYPNGNVYCASKHAVDACTSSMRLDLFKHNIRVSQISPAHVEQTEFAKVRFDGDMKKANIYSDFNPLTSADVAHTIYYIASRPKHVNIQDVLLMGTQQASSNFIDRTGRKYS